MSSTFNPDRRRLLATGAAGAAAIAGWKFAMPETGQGGRLAALRGATTWLNSPARSAENLRGKVVLIDFWTYTCINSIRQLPYLRAWSGKYGDAGLVVIGVHTPEFDFERDLGNVREQSTRMGVNYPVAVDSDYAIWKGLDNHYWPAIYVFDAKGARRHSKFGEGEYDKTESAIQKLLAEAGARGLGREIVSPTGQGLEAVADWENLDSPETYLGADRSERFVRDAGKSLRLNQWAVAGNWTIGRQGASTREPNGRITYRFHARDVHLVMGPSARGSSVRYRVRLDGQPPGIAHGIDVDAQGNGVVQQQRLYQLIRQPRPIVDRQFEVEFLDPGVEAFVFTFG